MPTSGPRTTRGYRILTVISQGIGPNRARNASERSSVPPHPRVTWALDTVLMAAICAWAVNDTYTSLRYGGPLLLVLSAPRLLRFQFRASDAVAILFACLASLSLFWTVDQGGSLAFAINQLCVAAAYIGIRATASEPHRVLTLAIGVLVGGAASFLRLLLRDPVAQVSDAAIPDRAAIEGINSNYTAYALSLCFVLAVLMLRHASRSLPTRAILITGAACFLGGVYLTGTRGAFLGVALASLWFLFSRTLHWYPLRLVAFLAVAAAAAISVGVADPFLLQEAVPGRETGTLNGRLPLWQEARELISASPFIGHGAGAFRAIIWAGIPAHNILLETAVGLGAIGVLGLGLWLYLGLIRETGNPANMTARADIVGAFIACAAPIYLSGYWDQSPIGWIVLALATRAAQITPARPTHLPAGGTSLHRSELSRST